MPDLIFALAVGVWVVNINMAQIVGIVFLCAGVYALGCSFIGLAERDA